MKRVPMFRKGAYLLLAVWIAGAAIWLVLRPTSSEPILGRWKGNLQIAFPFNTIPSQLRVNGDGTYERTDAGQLGEKGNWKSVKAWKQKDLPQWFADPAREQSEEPFYTEEQVRKDASLEEQRVSGELLPCAYAYLFDNGHGRTWIIVPREDGQGLESGDPNWNWHRSRGWPRWLTDRMALTRAWFGQRVAKSTP